MAGGCKMPEFGLIHYNFKGTLEEFLAFAQEAGFQCTELMHRDIWDAANGESFEDAKKRAEQVRLLLEKHQMRASTVAAGNDFVVPDKDTMVKQVERMKQMCELARITGTSLLRIDGGWAKESVPAERQVYLDLIVDGLKRVAEYVENNGFRLALDNHGLVTNDADFQIEVFERVGCKNLGANVDTMNYRWAGHDLETVRGFYKKIAPYVFHTHFKDGTGSRAEYVGTALGEGEIPLAYAVECLKAVGYQGPWNVEYEGKTDAREGFRKGLAWLKAHV
jgi:sugar phosphate isomerase/epimerase